MDTLECADVHDMHVSRSCSCADEESCVRETDLAEYKLHMRSYKIADSYETVPPVKVEPGNTCGH